MSLYAVEALAETILAIDIKYHNYIKDIIDDIKIAFSNCEFSIKYKASDNEKLFNLSDDDLNKIVGYFKYYNFACYFSKVNGMKIFGISWGE